MSIYKVNILTKPDEIRPVKPENLEVIYCPNPECEKRVILKIEPKEEKKIITKIKPIKKEEPVKEVVMNSTGEQSMDIQKEAVKELDLIPRPYLTSPDHVTHEHKINISLTAMIFSLLSMLTLVVLMKFL